RKIMLEAEGPLGVRSDMELGRQHNVLTAGREDGSGGGGPADERCAGWERVGCDGGGGTGCWGTGCIGIIAVGLAPWVRERRKRVERLIDGSREGRVLLVSL